MIDNESPRRVAESFEVRRTAPNVYELLVDGEILPWDFVDEVTVASDPNDAGIAVVDLKLIVDGTVTIDPAVKAKEVGVGVTRYSKVYEPEASDE